MWVKEFRQSKMKSIPFSRGRRWIVVVRKKGNIFQNTRDIFYLLNRKTQRTVCHEPKSLPPPENQRHIPSTSGTQRTYTAGRDMRWRAEVCGVHTRDTHHPPTPRIRTIFSLRWDLGWGISTMYKIIQSTRTLTNFVKSDKF